MMKYIVKYILVVLIASAYACNSPQTTGDEPIEVGESEDGLMAKADSVPVPDTMVKAAPKQAAEVRADYSDSLDFEHYKVDAEKILKHAPLDWTSYPGAKDFKTRITESYKTDEVDFAGYYVTAVFGCGASCIMGFMIDVRDGKIYDLPLGEENSCLFAEERALGNRNSRLFVAGVCKKNPDDQTVYYNAFLWNEEKKTFEKPESEAFLKK